MSGTSSDPVITELETESQKYEQLEAEEPEWVDLLGSGSIMKKIVHAGVPDTKPHQGEKCTINYVSKFVDGTLVDHVEKLEMHLGDCDVIQGLDVAVALMNLNEKCLLKIEPRLAYGKKGLPPKVPENAIVMFEVELIKVEPVDEIEELSISERKVIGNKKRERGNWWYCRGENHLAIACYRRALNYLDEVEGGIKDPLPDGQAEVTDAELQGLLEDRISVCNNMAAAQIKLELYDPALISLQTVLRCQPNNVKALFRKATIFKAKNDLLTAMSTLQKAKDIAPDNDDIRRFMNQIQMIMNKQKGAERELARRMFNGTIKQENKQTVKSKLRIWATVGAVAIGIAGMMAYKFKIV